MNANDTIKNNSKKERVFTTKLIVKLGLLIAISIVLKLVFEIMVPIAGFPALRINFTTIPIIITGVVFGPLAGFIVGAFSDIFCYILKPVGAFFPGFTLSSALCGFIPGIVYKFIKSSNEKKINYNILNIFTVLMLSVSVIIVMVSQGIISLSESGLLYQDNKISLFYMAFYILIVLSFIIVPFYFTKKEIYSNSIYSLDKIFFMVTTTQFVTSLLLNTWFLSILFGQGFLLFLPARIVTNFIVIPLFSIIVFTILKYIKI